MELILDYVHYILTLLDFSHLKISHLEELRSGVYFELIFIEFFLGLILGFDRLYHVVALS